MSTRWWTCSHCTFVNERRQDACEMCNKSRYAPQQVVYAPAQPQVVFTTTGSGYPGQVMFTTGAPPVYPTVQSTYNYRPAATYGQPAYGQPTVIIGQPMGQPMYMQQPVAQPQQPVVDEAKIRADVERKLRAEMEAKVKLEMEAARAKQQAQLNAQQQMAQQQLAQQQAMAQAQLQAQQQQLAMQQQQAAQAAAAADAMARQLSQLAIQAEEEKKKKEIEENDGDVKTEIREPGWKCCVKCQSLYYAGKRRTAAGAQGACPAGGAHADTLDPSKAGAGVKYGLVHRVEFAQKAGGYVQNWLWCKKCAMLFIDVDANTDGKCGVCPVDKKQHESDIKSKDTLKYALAMTKVDAAHEAGWVWCHKCSCLIMKSAEKQSKCPAGGAHDASKGTKNYAIMIMGDKDNVYPWAEGGWRWCGTCRGLFYSGSKRTPCKVEGKTTVPLPGGCCPGSSSKGPHDDWKQSQNYWPCQDLAYARRTGHYFEGWRWCGQCGAMFIDVDASPDGKCGVCPIGGQHVAPKDSPVLALTDKGDATFQMGWVWCHKCSGLFLKTDEKDSRCPAGGPHDSSRGTRTYGVQTSPVSQ